MNNSVTTMMKDGTVVADECGEILDFGPFKALQIQVHVKVAANSGSTLQMQHSAVDDEDTFIDLGSAIDIATTGNKIGSEDEFLRYVRFKASSGITTQPTLSMYVVAKES